MRTEGFLFPFFFDVFLLFPSRVCRGRASLGKFEGIELKIGLLLYFLRIRCDADFSDTREYAALRSSSRTSRHRFTFLEERKFLLAGLIARLKFLTSAIRCAFYIGREFRFLEGWIQR